MKKQIKRIIVVFLVLAMTVGEAPLNGFVGLKLPQWLMPNTFGFEAKAEEYYGEYYHEGNASFWWSYSNFVLYINGYDGVVPSFNYGEEPWAQFSNEILGIQISDNISYVESYAFLSCNNLRDVIIGGSALSVANYAFPTHSLRYVYEFCVSADYLDTYLKWIPSQKVILVSQYVSMGLEYDPVRNDVICEVFSPDFQYSGVSFSGKYWNYDFVTKQLTIMEGFVISPCCSDVMQPPWHMYENYIEKIVLNQTVYPNRDGMFSLPFLKELVVSSNVLMMAGFSHCPALETVTIEPNSQLEQIEEYAFSGCTALTNISFGTNSSLTEIGDYAFEGCDSLTEITLPESVRNIGESAFIYCNALANISFGTNSSLTEIGDYAFYSCNSLTEITLPESVRNIGGYAFSSCYALANISFGTNSSLVEIGNNAFGSCDSLTEITLPESVRNIGESAFSSCHALEEINVAESNGSYCSESGVLFNKEKTELLVYPVGKSDTSYTVPESVRTIGDYAFYYCSNLADLNVPISVEKVGKSAVFGSQWYNSLSPGVVYVGSIAYDYKGTMPTGTVLILNEGTKSISDNAFSREQGLSGISLPQSLTDIGAYAFFNCSELTNIELPASLENIDQSAFSDCAKLNSVVFAENIMLTVLPESIFSNCHSLETIVLPTGIQQIHNNAFYHSEKLRSIYIPSSVSIIDTDALSGLNSPTVHCHANSLAHQYAVNHFLNYQLMNGNSYTPAKIQSCVAIGFKNKIALKWVRATESETVQYRVFRKAETQDCFSQLDIINSPASLTYEDTQVQRGVRYYYYIIGVSPDGFYGSPSDTCSAVAQDDIQAPTITGALPCSNSVIGGIVIFSFSASDNIGITEMTVHYSADGGHIWNEIEENTIGLYSLDTSAIQTDEILIKAVACDDSGNESEPFVGTYFIDKTGPQKVSNINWISSESSAKLVWTAPTGEEYVSYSVEIKNDDNTYSSVSERLVSPSAAFAELSPGTSYTYRVIAYDAYGNVSEPSHDVTIVTKADSTPPVIESITPDSGTFGEFLPICVVASDNNNVQSISILVSCDGKNWTNAYSKDYVNVSKERELTYNLPLNEYSDGGLYLKAICQDSYENTSDADSIASTVFNSVDRTSPKAPESISAVSQSDGVAVFWSIDGQEYDNTYSVYRSTSESGEYTKIADSISTSEFVDKNAEENNTYFYKVLSSDIAGNVSVFSQAASTKTIKDNLPPEIVSIYPGDQKSIGNNFCNISVFAKDNRSLSKIVVEYKNEKDWLFSNLREISDINDSEKTVSFNVPTDNFDDGEKVVVRICAYDSCGNKSEKTSATYTVDQTAPIISAATASLAADGNTVCWNCPQGIADIAAFNIYRKIDGENYRLLKSMDTISGRNNYSYNDTDMALRGTTYYYKIEAVDFCNNIYYSVSNSVIRRDSLAPVAMLICDSYMECDSEFTVDARQSLDNSEIVRYAIDFGDGTAICLQSLCTHKYRQSGEYTVTLTVTDDDGNEATCQKTVTVYEKGTGGTVIVHTVDESGNNLINAGIYFDLGEEHCETKRSDATGSATFAAKVGMHTVGCFIDGGSWIPAISTIEVKSGATSTVTLVLKKNAMVDGRIHVERMKYDEIEDAGIDVKASENQNFVKINIELSYGDEKVKTNFNYNQITGSSDAKPINVVTSSGEKHRITPVVIKNSYRVDNELAVAFLDVPIEISALKDFFDVNLCFLNNMSPEYCLTDNTVKLNVPNGLSIVETEEYQNKEVVRFSDLSGMTSMSISWLLRGDSVGSYLLSADYNGIVSIFNEPVSAVFTNDTPVKVFGVQGLTVTLDVANMLEYGSLYYNVSLTNNSSEDICAPSVRMNDTLFATELFDESGIPVLERIASVEQYENSSEINKIDTRLLKPGERLVMHYVCWNQTDYTEAQLNLTKVLNKYKSSNGVELKINEKALTYFTGYLNANDNAVAKVALLSGTNSREFEALTDNRYYMYWNLYMSNGLMEEQLTTNGDENWWNTLKLLSGSGSFKETFGAEDDEQIKKMLLEMMKLSVEETDDIAFRKSVDFLKEAKKAAEKLKFDELGKLSAQKIGELIPQTFELIYQRYQYEFYSLAIESEEYCFDDYIISKFKYTEVYSSLTIEQIEILETNSSKLLHKLFSSKGFADVWKMLGLGLNVIDKTLSVCEDVATDCSIFIKAQSNIESCNLFLDAIIENADTSTSDGRKVADVATKLKKTINENNPVSNFINKALEETAYEIINTVYKNGKKALLGAIGATPAGIVKIALMALKIYTNLADSLLNFSQRDDIADSIRFISIITNAITEKIQTCKRVYFMDDTEANAKSLMQLISYLCEIRRIGESLVAQYGGTYDTILLLDGDNLLERLNFMCATNALSYVEWRNEVQDRLLLLKIHLLKDPELSYENYEPIALPEFNYISGITQTIYSSDYEYSTDCGNTWHTCIGAISVPPTQTGIWLSVRKVAQADESNLATRRYISAIPRLSSKKVTALSTTSGIAVSNLDKGCKYEYTLVDDYETQPDFDTLSGTEFVADENGTAQLAYGAGSYLFIRKKATSEYFSSACCSVKIEQASTIEIRPFSSSGYTLDNSHLFGIVPFDNTVANVKSNLENANILVRDAIGNQLNENDIVSTGCTVSLISDVETVDEATVIIIGDVTMDGFVNNRDVSMILRKIIGKETLIDVQNMAADINADGNVNNRDAAMLLRYFVGKETIY